jgi:protein TonB
VKLEPEPVPVDPVKKDETPPPTIESPEPVAAIDLPPVAPVQAIAAVPSTVPVSFGIEVKGPVRWVNDPSQASGAVGGRRQPISLDADGAARNLLLPSLPYPPEAKKRRLTGSLTVEFRTTPTGDIQDVRVRESSGHDELDRAAIENLRKGRWVGPAGFYVKAYEFNLK